MHESYLMEALNEARKREGFTSPNPAVGAVLVRKGAIISRGYHLGAGHPHAEVEALKSISESTAVESTLYVTLEPCCHQGRTGPCVDLILSKKVREVVFAFLDPNPVVAGKGQQALIEKGVSCTHFPLLQIDRFYQPYQYWWSTGTSFITAKLAMSLDGKIAGPDSSPVAITEEKTRVWTHIQRLRADGVLTTAETISNDNPRLNVRLGSEETPKRVFILDRLAKTPPKSQVFPLNPGVVLFHSQEAREEKLQAFRSQGVKTVCTPTLNAFLDLKFVAQYLGKTEGVHHVLAEVGGKALLGLHQAQVLKRAFFLVAPKWLGKDFLSAFDSLPQDFFQNSLLAWSSLGQDALLDIEWK